MCTFQFWLKVVVIFGFEAAQGSLPGRYGKITEIDFLLDFFTKNKQVKNKQNR